MFFGRVGGFLSEEKVLVGVFFGCDFVVCISGGVFSK